MKTVLSIPSNGKLFAKEVSIDLNFGANHHRTLLTGADQVYEKVVCSVLSDLAPEADMINKTTIGDLYYLFFYCRSVSVDTNYHIPWTCNKQIQGVPCDQENIYTMDLTRMVIKEAPEDLVFTRYPIKLTTGDEIQIYVRFLSCKESFEILDSFNGKGIPRQKLYDEYAYEYAWEKMLRAVASDDPRWPIMTLKDKDALITGSTSSYKLINELLLDSRDRELIGPDMSPVSVVCKKCGGVSKLEIPFSPEFLLPARKR